MDTNTIQKSGQSEAEQLTSAELHGEAERIAVNLRSRGHYLAATIMRELIRRNASPPAGARDAVADALRLVMQYPDIRSYLGKQICDAADAALTSKADDTQPAATGAGETLMKCICTLEGQGCTNRCDRGQFPPIPAMKVALATNTAATGMGDALDAARWRMLRDHMPKKCNHDKGYIQWYLPRSRGGFMGLQEHIDSLIDRADLAAQPAPVVGGSKVWPSPEFEEWFAGIEAGDGTIPVPQSIADGDAWHEHIGRRQIALGAWEAALASKAAGGAQ